MKKNIWVVCLSTVFCSVCLCSSAYAQETQLFASASIGRLCEFVGSPSTPTPMNITFGGAPQTTSSTFFVTCNGNFQVTFTSSTGNNGNQLEGPGDPIPLSITSPSSGSFPFISPTLGETDLAGDQFDVVFQADPTGVSNLVPGSYSTTVTISIGEPV